LARGYCGFGDAAGFMDPIFSAGVYLAMHSGALAARLVLDSLDAGSDGKRGLRIYEKRVFARCNFTGIWWSCFYTTPFMELFMQPRPKFHLPDAMVAILAGELEGAG